MFRFFENIIDPYQRYDERAEFPNRLIPFVLSFIRPARWLLVSTMVLSAIFALIEAGLAWYAGKLVDLFADNSPAQVWAEHGTTLIFLAVLVILIRPAIQILDAMITSQGYFAQMGALIRWRTHRKMLRQSMSFFTDDFAGRIANRQIQLAPAINDSVHHVTQELWYFASFIIGTALILAELNAELLLPLGIWLGLFLAIAVWFVPRITKRGKAVADARSTLAGRIVDSYTNIQTVKLFADVGQEEDYARTAMEDFRWTFARELRLYTWLTISLACLSTVLIGGVIGYAVWLWTLDQVTVGAIAATAALVLRLNGMVDWIMWMLAMLFQQIGTIHEGMEMVSQPLRLKDREDARPMQLTDGAIRFQGVTHRYGKEAGGVEKIGLEIAGGERVGLVGRSGAGKSTLVNLTLRFYDPDQGRVLIDGQDLATLTQDSIRARIAMVTQDTSLLHRSIADNIRYGRAGATMEEVWEAARKVRADGFIPDLVDQEGNTGMDALVGERGVRLSGGQRQRIALARAVLKDAPILILDEATSALDSEVEAEIQDALYEFMEGKTVIAIAHRLSTIQRMNRIVVLDEAGSSNRAITIRCWPARVSMLGSGRGNRAG